MGGSLGSANVARRAKGARVMDLFSTKPKGKVHISAGEVEARARARAELNAALRAPLTTPRSIRARWDELTHEQRVDETLRVMLNTPPRPHKGLRAR